MWRYSTFVNLVGLFLSASAYPNALSYAVVVSAILFFYTAKYEEHLLYDMFEKQKERFRNKNLDEKESGFYMTVFQVVYTVLVSCAIIGIVDDYTVPLILYICYKGFEITQIRDVWERGFGTKE